MKRPMIGLTPQFDPRVEGAALLRGPYLESIEEAGGIPLILPFISDGAAAEQLVSLCDAIIFTGGPDISPKLYGEEPIPECGEPSEKRDVTEKLIFDAVFPTDKPVLGICRGVQTINVMLGGTLIQDLPSQHPSDVAHVMEPPADRGSHRVTIKEGTPLMDIFGETELSVNSLHHQAVKTVGKGLEVAAVSEDGVTEGLYLPGERFFCAVQWHPELMHKVDEFSRKLFAALVRACSGGK